MIGTVAGRSLEVLDGAWLLAVFGLAAACAILMGLLELLDRDNISKGTFNAGAATVAIAVVAVPLIVLAPWDSLTAGRSCAEPVELTVLVPNDGDSAFTEVLGAFVEQYTDDEGCVRALITPLTAPWLEIESALLSGWDDDELREHGPPPAVWIAESATQIEAIAESRLGTLPAIDSRVRIGISPIVLGVPESRDDEFVGGETGRRYRSDILMAEYLALDGTAVVRSDPTMSFTGAATLHTLYDFGANPASDSHKIETDLAWSLEDTGLSAGSDSALLCQLRERGGASPATAVFTSERALLAFDSDGPLGSECPSSARAIDRLRAYYPLTAASLDYTAVRLSWTDAWGPNSSAVEGHRDATAEALISWLADDDGQDALDDIGVRPAYRPFSPTDDSLVRPDLDVLANPLPPDQYAENMDQYYRNRRETRVLLAVDLSGSMVEQTGTGQSRFELAVDGVDTALRYLKPADSFGLWAFSGSADEPYVPLLDIESSDDPRARQTEAVKRLSAQTPSGKTPLHATIAEGIAALETDDDATQSVLVVLTDGNDTEGGVDFKEMLKDAPSWNTPIHIIAIGEASCSTNAIGELAEASRGSCRNVHLDSITIAFDALFHQIWGAEADEGGN